MEDANDPVVLAGNARDAFWARWGQVEPDVLAHAINPSFQGGPRWPALRQAWRVVRRGPLTLIASDGLSYPFDSDWDDATGPGFGLEVFAVTPDRVGRPANRTWLMQLVWNASQLAADNQTFRELLDKHGVISTQLYDVNVPPECKLDDGSVGVLLNVQDRGPNAVPTSMTIPMGDVLAVNVKLLTRLEAKFGVANGAKGRAAIAERFTASVHAQASSLTRQSVVSPPPRA
jgi:hypothetical protein